MYQQLITLIINKMIGSQYRFFQDYSCCESKGDTDVKKRDQCPGICGIIAESFYLMDISGNGADVPMNESSSTLLHILRGPVQKNRVNLIRQIPYFCCNYIHCLTCYSAQILLHNKYEINSPYYKCLKIYPISNNSTLIGTITQFPGSCFGQTHFQVNNMEGELVQSVTRVIEPGSDGRLVYKGVDANGNQVSRYEVNKECCGPIEILANFFVESENTRLLGMALVPYI